MLTIASLLSILLLTFHFTDDILRRGMEAANTPPADHHDPLRCFQGVAVL